MFLIVFLSIAAAIAVNALYLQHAPRLVVTAVQEPPLQTAPEPVVSAIALPKSDPLVPEATAAAAPKHLAEAERPRPAGAVPEHAVQTPAPRPIRPAAAPPGKPSPPAPPRVIKAIQRELQLRGYMDEPATGTLGPTTRAAILSYEFDEGLPLAGEASEAILKSLIFGRAEGKAGPGPAERFEERRALVAQVQAMLAAMGYPAGPPDGRLDAKTRDAIRQFESDRHLSARGRLTERVLLEMVIVAGRPIIVNG
jgi:peptidoglycan hydrolase-like protein with peptidoglycan-binding domain